jgi:hypothetical protein
MRKDNYRFSNDIHKVKMKVKMKINLVLYIVKINQARENSSLA